MNMGKLIKESRKKRGMTQKQLADAIGVSTVTIQNYENNRREPNMETLSKIGAVLKVFFFKFSTEEENSKLYELSQVDSSHLFHVILKYMENTKNFKTQLEFSFLDEITEEDTKEDKNLITTTEITEIIDKMCDFMEFEIHKLEKQKLSNIE